MSERLAELLAAAEVECAKEMNRLAPPREGAPLISVGDRPPLPRLWFEYNSMQRKIVPLRHQADRAARRAAR